MGLKTVSVSTGKVETKEQREVLHEKQRTYTKLEKSMVNEERVLSNNQQYTNEADVEAMRRLSTSQSRYTQQVTQLTEPVVNRQETVKTTTFTSEPVQTNSRRTVVGNYDNETRGEAITKVSTSHVTTHRTTGNQVRVSGDNSRVTYGTPTITQGTTRVTNGQTVRVNGGQNSQQRVIGHYENVTQGPVTSKTTSSRVTTKGQTVGSTKRISTQNYYTSS